MGSETDRVVVIARGRLPVTAMMQLHRSLGLGVTEVRRRLEAGTPLIDRGLWLNDQPRLEALLQRCSICWGNPLQRCTWFRRAAALTRRRGGRCPSSGT